MVLYFIYCRQLADTDKVIYVYKPQKSFKKSSPGEPNIVVIVTKLVAVAM